MRHRIKGRKLGRNASHRKAMYKNMMLSLLKYERIRTTLVKAKELRSYIEPVITRAKENTLHNKRIVLKKIRDRKILVKLFEVISPRYKDRPGGYTRIMKLSRNRVGDNSKMALIELVEGSFDIGGEEGFGVEEGKGVGKDKNKDKNKDKSKKEKNKKVKSESKKLVKGKK